MIEAPMSTQERKPAWANQSMVYRLPLPRPTWWWQRKKLARILRVGLAHMNEHNAAMCNALLEAKADGEITWKEYGWTQRYIRELLTHKPPNPRFKTLKYTYLASRLRDNGVMPSLVRLERAYATWAMLLEQKGGKEFYDVVYLRDGTKPVPPPPPPVRRISEDVRFPFTKPPLADK